MGQDQIAPALWSGFRSGGTTNSNRHCERQRSNLGPLSAPWVEIASSRKRASQ
jgi:hypothetical protein